MHHTYLQGRRPAALSPSSRLFLAAACAATCALAASAQAPKPPGNFGIEVVAEDPGAGLSDILTVLPLAAAVPGFPLAPFFQLSLAVDVDGDGILDLIKINAAENGTTWQVRTAPEMVIAIDPVLATPIVFLPITVTFSTSGTSATALGFVDFRAGLPISAGVTSLVSLVDIPLRLLDDGAGRLYVAESIAGVGGVMTVSEVSFAGGAPPTLTAAALVNGIDAEFQDRMALGAGGASLSIPHSNGVDVFTVPGLGLLGTIPMPANGAGVPYVPVTNILGGLPGPFDMIVFGGQPGGGGGHTFVSWSSATGLPGPNGGTDPAGAALRTAPGFHEPAFTPTAGGTGTVTALLDTFPFGAGAGAGRVFQVLVGAGGPAGTVITPVASPFGDPAPSGNGFAEPIGFQIGTATVDFFQAVSAGVFTPAGTLSPQVPLTGFINPGDSPAPLAMSTAGFPTTNFALTTSIGFRNVNVFTVTPGLVVTGPALVPAGLGASSLGTVWTQAAVGGALPVGFQQAAGLGVLLQVGFPLLTPLVSFLALDPNAIPPMPFGGFVAVPAPQGALPTVSAARTSLNFGATGVQASWVTLHPSPGILPPFAGTATIAPATAYGFFAAFYPGTGAFVTEFASF